MSDLIDRQAAIDTLESGAELLRRVLDITDIVGAEREKYKWGLELIESCISDMKALPSAEPKRGKWISEGQKNKGLNFWMHCSLCGYKTIDAPSSRTNFCPICGARMEAKDE